MENNYEEFRKDVDLSSFDVDAESFDRKLLELNAEFNSKAEFEESFYAREFGLVNNYEDELQRRTKLAAVNSDFEKHMLKLAKDYEEKLTEIAKKYEKKKEYPYYFEWLFIGDSRNYERLMNGLTYYIKKTSDSEILVYHDAKFSKYLGSFKYVSDDWKEV